MFLSRLTTYPLWRSLRHRNYRLYLIGQLVSVCGTWMQQVAQSWLIYRLTGSATLLGLVGFATQIPVFVLGAIGGVVSDRYSSHRVALWTQTAALLQAIILATLTLAGWIQPLHIILLGVVLGVVNAFDMPARQALVHRLIAPDDLANAVALNSSMINAARIIGHRIGSRHRRCNHRLRSSIDRVYRFQVILVIAVASCGCRIGLDGADRCQQHGVTNPLRRCDARACNEPFYPDAGRYGAVWKPPRGMARRSNRRPVDCRDRRRDLRFRGACIRASTTAPESSGATDFDRAWDYRRAEHRGRIGRHRS